MEMPKDGEPVTVVIGLRTDETSPGIGFKSVTERCTSLGPMPMDGQLAVSRPGHDGLFVAVCCSGEWVELGLALRLGLVVANEIPGAG